MRAHDRAVRDTLDWIGAEFLQTRGYDPNTGKRPREAADGMIATTFRHVASRGNDPQLHTHVVLANMTRSQADTWRSVEPTLLMRNRRLIGAWYRNTLARILTDGGYRLTPTTVGGLPGFEFADYSQALRSMPDVEFAGTILAVAAAFRGLPRNRRGLAGCQDRLLSPVRIEMFETTLARSHIFVRNCGP